MPAAARVGDQSIHGGTVVGPGVPTVVIGGMPAAVLIQGRPALRAGDSCACGASVAVGLPTVVLG